VNKYLEGKVKRTRAGSEKILKLYAKKQLKHRILCNNVPFVS